MPVQVRHFLYQVEASEFSSGRFDGAVANRQMHTSMQFIYQRQRLRRANQRRHSPLSHRRRKGDWAVSVLTVCCKSA